MPDEAVVISQYRVLDARGVVREADFLVLVPGVGAGVIEVKGGLVWTVEGDWYSRDHAGRDHAIKDPMWQAHKAGYTISDFVHGQDMDCPSLVPIVVLPDTTLPKAFVPADSRRTQWIDGVVDLAARVSAALYSGECFDVDALLDVLERRLPKPSTRQKVALASRHADMITRDQYGILRALRANDRILVTGGPGTGKTWLALEHARQETVRGARVALLCYNRGLALHLGQVASGWPADQRPAWIGTLHELALEWTGTQVPPEAQQEFWDGLPGALAAAALDSDDRFDLVVVDEAQDFAASWWDAVHLLLWDPASGPLVLFGDDDQRLYPRESEGLLAVEVELSQNVRNTEQIAAALQVLSGDIQDCRGASGPPVEFFESSADRAVEVANQVVAALLDAGDFDPADIALLTTWRRHPEHVRRIEELGAVGFAQSLLSPDDVAVCTVKGFKGLERPAVVLAINGFHDQSDAQALLRVGVSRATHLLAVVGPKEWLSQLGHR